jgi:hypothetical protein
MPLMDLLMLTIFLPVIAVLGGVLYYNDRKRARVKAEWRRNNPFAEADPPRRWGGQRTGGNLEA